MGVFSRICDIFKANINDLVDRAENPEKMVKQIVVDLRKEVNKSTQALGKAMASQRIVIQQYQNAVNQSSEWENKAKSALSAENTRLAKKALSNKVRFDKDVTFYKQMYETITNQTEAIRTQIETTEAICIQLETLKYRLEESKNQQDMIITRSRMVKNQKHPFRSSGGINSFNTMNKVNRIEKKVIHQESEALSDFDNNNEEIFDSFEQLQTAAMVDSELNRIMAEIS